MPGHHRRRELHLTGEPADTRRARRVVAQACREWDLPDLVIMDAELVVAELTANLVRHARSGGCLRLELHGRFLTVALTDDDPRSPRLRPPEQRREGGRGLVLIAELSRAWGWVPRIQGGKVVWAALAVPARRPHRPFPVTAHRPACGEHDAAPAS